MCFHTGNFEVGVHIADVSYFVEEGSVLDATASQRATSVYLVQKVGALLRMCWCSVWEVWESIPLPVLLQVIPMLPRLLCEELCSLNPLSDRLTFSVVWTITPEGKVGLLKTQNGCFSVSCRRFRITFLSPFRF